MIGIGDIGRRGGDQVGEVRVGPFGWWPSIVGVVVVGGLLDVMIGGSFLLRVVVVRAGMGVL